MNNLGQQLTGFLNISDDCVTFLRNQAQSLELPVKVYEHYKGKPIVVITWVGTDPSAPSVLLNSHMDVVPVFAVSIFYNYTKNYSNSNFI